MYIPRIRELMVAQPWTVGSTISVVKARQLMHDHGIRHLPVLNAGHLAGVVSDRDLRIVECLHLAESTPIYEVMTSEPYVVEMEPLDKVLNHMVEHKYGCALVRDDKGEVIGIFTETDAMRFCADLFRKDSIALAA